MDAAPPGADYPKPPKGHTLSTCKCRICGKIRTDRPDALEYYGALAAETARIRAQETINGPKGEWHARVASPSGMVGPKTKALVAQWLALKALEPGITKSEAAKRLNVPEGTLYSYIYKAAREGLLDFDDPLSRIEFRVIPQAVDNLEHLLREGDKQATLETVKGTIFKEWADAKGVKDVQQTVLALKIEAPPADLASKPIQGRIVGKPKGVSEEPYE